MKNLEQIKIYHSKVLKLFASKEYFDVLSYSQKCSLLIGVKKLRDLRDNESFKMLMDCFKCSSIAYLQLQQYQQAITLTSEILENAKYDIQAMLVRSRAYQGMGRLTEALQDLQRAQRLDCNNQKVRDMIRKIEESDQMSTSSSEKGAVPATHPRSPSYICLDSLDKNVDLLTVKQKQYEKIHTNGHKKLIAVVFIMILVYKLIRFMRAITNRKYDEMARSVSSVVLQTFRLN